MAPRRRAVKKTRVDGAIEHMTRLGFDERLVRTTLKQLVKEYGGEDNIAFIEEDGYLVLIEALLHDQEPNNRLEYTTEKQGVSSQDERAEHLALQGAIVPLGTLFDSTCVEVVNTAEEAVCSVLGSTAGEPTATGSTEVLCLPTAPAAGDGSGWKDIREDQMETARVVYGDGNSGNKMQPPPQRSNTHVPPASPISSRPCPVSPHPPRKRAPCYGWIESDEEEDDERVEEPVSQRTYGPSGILVKTTCFELGSAAVEPKREEHCPNQEETVKPDTLCLSLAEGNENIAKDTREDKTLNIVSYEGGSSKIVMRPCGSNSRVSTTCSPCLIDHLSVGSLVPSSKQVNLQPPRRIFPCYGWIGRNGEDPAAIEFIQLTPRKPSTCDP